MLFNVPRELCLVMIITVLVGGWKAQITWAAPTSVTKTAQTTGVISATTTTKSASATFGATTTVINLQITNRTAWQAAPSRRPTATTINGASAGGNTGPMPYVIIHHTSRPEACHTSATCKAAVRSVQRSHQSDRGWDDIGYNFLIGGGSEAAAIYEGRGFGVIGAHAVGFNSQSVGICLIGDWSVALPPAEMLEKLKQLITYGIQHGHIQKNYKLLGHRQVRATSCPGNRLFNELQQWQHFSARGPR